MFEGCKIAFIGSGAMAEAMISGLIRNQLAEVSLYLLLILGKFNSLN